MIAKTFILGALLTALGLIGYIASGAESITALIPAIFGILLLLLGQIARNEQRHQLAMHLAVALAVLGFLGSISGVPKAIIWLSGADVVRPMAIVAQSLMALLCLWYLVYAIRSFIEARRSK